MEIACQDELLLSLQAKQLRNEWAICSRAKYRAALRLSPATPP